MLTLRFLPFLFVVGCVSSSATAPIPEIYSTAICTGDASSTLECALAQVDEVLIGRVVAVRGYTSPSARPTATGYDLTEECAQVKMALELDMLVLQSLKAGLTGTVTVRIGPTQLDYYAPMPIGVNRDGAVQWVGSSPYGSRIEVGAEIGVLLTQVGLVWTILTEPMFYLESGLVRVQHMRECAKDGLLAADGQPVAVLKAAIETGSDCQAYRGNDYGLWLPLCLGDGSTGGCVLDTDCQAGMVCQNGRCVRA